MMERFTEEEAERLSRVLPVELNPFLNGAGSSFKFQLGSATKRWLFETHMNLPADAQKELEHILSDDVPASERVLELDAYLARRQASSAPQWWELEFFEVKFGALWNYFAEQCRRHYTHESLQEFYDSLLDARAELNEARHVLSVKKYGGSKYSEAEVQLALEIYDMSYPLDFRDYDEAPRKVRSPIEKIQQMVIPEISDLEAVFTKRWFEFKILDELAFYESYVHDSERDSPLSKGIASQLRSFMQGRLISLGRMIEHYRWKFSFETAALRGLQSEETAKLRGRKGGEASERTRRQNIECLLEELEKLADMFPRMSETAIFNQAYINASRRRRMPSSRKTIESYETTIRSEAPFKGRYDAIFRKNA